MATVPGTKRLLDISGNNISTALSLTASGTLLDVNGAAGASGQVLSSIGSGVDWVDASSVIGGPYLPLAGGTMTGQITATPGIEMGAGNINFADNGKVRLGSSSDLQIYHDGSNSYIQDTGTGSLKTVASGFQLLNSTQNQFMMLADGGATSWIKLY